MEGCAKFRGINYVAPTGKNATKELPVATNVDDPHGCDSPVAPGKHPLEPLEGVKNDHSTAGPCAGNIPLESGMAVCGARVIDENVYSIIAAECIETTCADGAALHKDENGERAGTEDNIFALTNTRGPIFDHP